MMQADTLAHRAIASMAAARACYECIPAAYDGRQHLGITLTMLDELVRRVSAFGASPAPDHLRETEP